MEITKYICEFFFNDFWHWLGLVILVAIIFKLGVITTIIDNSKNTNCKNRVNGNEDNKKD